MSLSAIDSVHHGLVNLRANWQLVIVLFLQTLAVSAISILGLVPIILVLGFTFGFGFLRSVLANMDSSGGAALLERVIGAGLPLIAAFLAAGLIWTIAFVVYCYFQAGIFGTLAAAEWQAVSNGGQRQSYRVFSSGSFLEFAEGLTWPIFWLVNLFVLLGLVAVAGTGFVMLAVFGMVGGEGLPAAQIGLGCLIFVFLVLFMMFLAVWMQLALAELAIGTRGVVAAARTALAIAGRRLPGVALLFLLLLVASIVVAIVFVPVSMVLEIALRDRVGVYLSGQALVTLVQWLVSGTLTVAWSATFVALVAGEREAP